MVEMKLTQFQLWSIFLLFTNSKKYLSIEEILIQCCNAKVSKFDANTIYDQLDALVDDPYRLLERDPNSCYKILDDGVTLLRHNIAQVHSAYSNDRVSKIPKDVIKIQDKILQDSLMGSAQELPAIIISCAVRNIEPVWELFIHVTRYYNNPNFSFSPVNLS